MDTPSWRQGRKVPINVYEGERAVCQCHTAEDAQRIVTAVNQQDLSVLVVRSVGRYDEVSPPQPTIEQLRALWEYVVGERERLGINCAETIYQTDRVAEAATEFIEGCMDRVGYPPLDDEVPA